MVSMAGATRRRIGWLLAAVAVVAGLAWAWAARVGLAQRAVDAAIASQGLPIAVRVVSLETNRAELRALRVGTGTPPLLEVERLDVGFGWRGLWEGRIESIEVDRVRAHATLDDDGSLSLPGFDPALADSDAEPTAWPALPLRNAVVQDLVATLDTPSGPVRATGDFRLDTGPPDDPALSGEATIAVSTAFGQLALELEPTGAQTAPEVAFRARGEFVEQPGIPVQIPGPIELEGTAHFDPTAEVAWTTHLSLARLLVPEQIDLRGIEANFEGRDTAFAGDFRVASAVELSRPALIAPLAVRGGLRGDLERAQLDARAHTRGEGMTLLLAGPVEPGALRADLVLEVPPIELGGPDRQLPRLFPWLAPTLSGASGEAAGGGAVQLRDGELRAQLELALDAVDLQTGVGEVHALSGSIRVDGPTPLQTPPDQQVVFAGVTGALPLGPGDVRFQYLDGIVALQDARFALAGGTLRASGQLPVDSEERALTLVAEDLDVTDLLELAAFDGLSGSGTLEGALPLRQRGENVSIQDGRLRAVAPGILRYRPAGAEAVERRGSDLGTLFGALSEFHYDTLELFLNGETDEAMDVQVRLAGSNPNFQEGRRVVLNVNVEAHLSDLVRGAQAAYRVPEAIEERLREFGVGKPGK